MFWELCKMLSHEQNSYTNLEGIFHITSSHTENHCSIYMLTISIIWMNLNLHAFHYYWQLQLVA